VLGKPPALPAGDRRQRGTNVPFFVEDWT